MVGLWSHDDALGVYVEDSDGRRTGRTALVDPDHPTGRQAWEDQERAWKRELGDSPAPSAGLLDLVGFAGASKNGGPLVQPRPAPGRLLSPAPWPLLRRLSYFSSAGQVGAEGCPDPRLLPWWPTTVVPPDEEPTAALGGTSLMWARSFHSPPDGAAKLPDVRESDRESSQQIYTYPSGLLFTTAAQIEEHRVGPSGAWALPGYSDARDMLSSATAKRSTLVLGAFVPFSAMSRVSLKQNLVRDKLQSVDLSVAFEDGWGEARLTISIDGRNGGIKRQADPLEFTTWVLQVVAHNRLASDPSDAVAGAAQGKLSWDPLEKGFLLGKTSSTALRLAGAVVLSIPDSQ